MKHAIVQTESSLESELLVSFFRKGELREARSFLSDLSGEASDAEKLVLIANNLAVVEKEEGNYTESLRLLQKVTPLIDSCGDLQRAKFCLNRGSAYEFIGREEGVERYLDLALVEYDGSAYYFQKANHRDEWCALNNAAFLLINFEKWHEVHSYLDRAEQVFKSRTDKDKSYRLAEIDDTRALCLLAENRIEESIFYASRSVHALVHSGEPRTYIQSKRTLERALKAQEHALTEWALVEAKGEIPATAKILQLPRATVGKRLRENKEYADLLPLAKFCEKRGMHAKK